MAGPAPMPITGIAMRGMITSESALGIASKTIEKQPASWRAIASRITSRPRSAVRPCER